MRTHSDHARAIRPFAEEDDSTTAAILYLLRQLPEDGAATCPGPEELLEVMESFPGADRAAVVDYFTFWPRESGCAG